MDYLYRLTFSPETSRSDVGLANVERVIRTECGPGIEVLDACDLFYRTHLIDRIGYDTNKLMRLAERCTDIRLLDGDSDEARLLRDTFTVRMKTPARRPYYVKPEGCVKTTVVRYDGNGEQKAPYVDIVKIPSNVYNRTCDETAPLDLLRQIAMDFCEQNGPETVRAVFPEGIKAADWNRFFAIPDGFLAKYGVAVEPVDNALTVALDMNGPIL